MSRLDYIYANGTYITSYTPWSDEFDSDLDDVLRLQRIRTSDRTGSRRVSTWTRLRDRIRTPVGQRQNFSMVDPAYGFRFETDPKPMTSVTLNATPTTPPAGSVVNLTATVTRGRRPLPGALVAQRSPAGVREPNVELDGRGRGSTTSPPTGLTNNPTSTAPPRRSPSRSPDLSRSAE